MGLVPGEIPRHDIARQVIRRVFRDFFRPPLSVEVRHEVGDPAVVDVRVRCREPVLGGVFREIRLHVGVHFVLQIGADRPKSPDNHVGAYAAVLRNVAHGEVEFSIRGIIEERHADLRVRTAEEFLRFRIGGYGTVFGGFFEEFLPYLGRRGLDEPGSIGKKQRRVNRAQNHRDRDERPDVGIRKTKSVHTRIMRTIRRESNPSASRIRFSSS